MIDLEAIRANATTVRRSLEQQTNYFSDHGAPCKTPVEQLVYDALALLAEVERLRGFMRNPTVELAGENVIVSFGEQLPPWRGHLPRFRQQTEK